MKFCGNFRRADETVTKSPETCSASDVKPINTTSRHFLSITTWRRRKNTPCTWDSISGNQKQGPVRFLTAGNVRIFLLALRIISGVNFFRWKKTKKKIHKVISHYVMRNRPTNSTLENLRKSRWSSSNFVAPKPQNCKYTSNRRTPHLLAVILNNVNVLSL